MINNIKLYGQQYQILQDWLNTNKNCIDIIHAGAGKSFLGSIALPIFCSDARYHKGRDVVYLAPTFSMAKTIMWNPLKDACKLYFNLPDSAFNVSELTIKFPDGNYLRMKSAEQGLNLRGMNISVAVLDEASLYSAEAIQEISNRLRPLPGKPETEGRMIVISTPHGNGPLYKLYNDALADPEKWIARHYNYLQMKSGNKKFIEKQKLILSPLKFAQDYMCVWESVEDQFFYTWGKQYIKPVTDRGGDLYIGFDFNKRVMNAVVTQVTNAGKTTGTVEVIKSYSIKDCGTEQMAQTIRADFNQRNIFAIIDMSGSQVNRDTTSPFGVTDRTILEKYGFTIINTKKSNPLISDTDNTSNAFIARGGLTVPSEETKLLEALNSYHYEDGARKKLVKSMESDYAHIDGLGDAVRYLLHHLFPINHNDLVNVPNHQTMDSRLTTIPGAQYRKQGVFGPGTPTFEELLSGSEMEDGYSEAVSWD